MENFNEWFTSKISAKLEIHPFPIVNEIYLPIVFHVFFFIIVRRTYNTTQTTDETF